MFTTRTDYLDTLLAYICEELQLTQTAHETAEKRYQAVGDWLHDPASALAPWDPTIYPQGSFATGTCTRPLSGSEFDLDLVCELILGPKSASPLVVLNMVEHRLREHSVYRGMIERKKRCVRLVYANEFHLDILPARPTWPPAGTRVLVPDREVSLWLPSNPKGYAAWFLGRAELYLTELRRQAAIEPVPDHVTAKEKAPLQRAVQLLKRARDVRYQKFVEAGPRSIVLTTLAGESFRGTPSTAETFGGIVRAISTTAAQNRAPFRVMNPAEPNELLSEQWERDPNTYQLFAGWIIDLNERWARVQQTATTEDVAAALGALFGESLTQRVFKRYATEQVEARRASGALGVARATGALSIATPRTAPVRTNTFYGEE